MKQLDDYIKAEKEVFKYFGFSEVQGTYPLDDNRDNYWFKNENEVIYYDSKESYNTNDGMHQYSDIIIKEYKQQEYTMFIVSDYNGTKYCSIFDNSKQVPTKNEE